MNYSYGTGSNRPNTQAFRDMFDKMNTYQSTSFDVLRTPDLAYEQWLRSMMPSLSNTQEKTLRSAFSSIYDNFLGKRQLNSPVGGSGGANTPMSWVEYLAKFDPYKELMRMAPEARYENQSRYTQPTRVVAF